MGLYFKNLTNETLWVAFARHLPGCEGGVDWNKSGWYKLPPGSTKKVLSGWAGGSKYFFYAEADDFNPAWSGPYFTWLPWASFDWCWNTASNVGRNLGLRKVEVSWAYMDYTVGLKK